jgi:hypothetical protein
MEPNNQNGENNEKSSVVDAVFDAALAWVDVGLTHLRTSLDGSARAMERTAKAIEIVRDRLRA